MTETQTTDLDKRFIREDGLAASIAALAEPVLADLGFRLVRVKISSQERTTVQIMADRPDGSFSIEDCTLVSRRLSPLFDVHDPIPSGYFLEVSSPGIDRPLVRPSDFEDWTGFEAKIELREMIDGRRRFRGILDGYDNGEARLKMHVDGMDGVQIVGVPVSLIHEAKLVMTDDLIRESLKAKAAQQQQQPGSGDFDGVEFEDDDGSGDGD